MNKEIERKFLVDDISIVLKRAWSHESGNCINWDIWQAYINDNVRVRVQVLRQPKEREVHYYLTIKSKRDSIERKEFEIEIDEKHGKELLSEFKKNSIKKSRYVFEYQEKTWEVDVFKEDNDGLLMAEIELESEDEKFELPPGIGKEVTGDERYYNSYLSKNPYQDWNENNR